MMLRFNNDNKQAGPNFHLGGIYYCCGIDFSLHDDFRVVVRRDSDGEPAVVAFCDFLILDSRVPDGWVCVDLGGGILRLQPSEFCGSFWDDFYEDVPDSIAIFESVYKKILEFHNN